MFECVCVYTSSDRGLMDLIVDAHVQGSLAHLLEVAGGGLTEALHGQANVLLPYEESLHHTLGCIQQVCKRHLER